MTKSEKSNYFATFQNAMHWAVASATAAEIRYERVDASKPFAGLTSFKNEQPVVRDGDSAKAFLGEDEIKRLPGKNRTNIFRILFSKNFFCLCLK